MKKLFFAILLLIMGFAALKSNASTASVENNTLKKLEFDLDYSSEIINEDGSREYRVRNGLEIAKAYNIENPKDVIITIFPEEIAETFKNSRSIGSYVKVTSGPSGGSGTRELVSQHAINNSTYTDIATLTLNSVVSNTVSGSLGVSNSIISTGVGFDVTRSSNKSQSRTVTLKPREEVMVTVFGLYDIYEVESYSFIGRKLGSGVVGKAKGVCIIISK